VIVPAASVVVVTRNRAGRLSALLESLARQTQDAVEVVVVDDRSSDETGDVLAGAAGSIPLRTVSVTEPIGLAELRNRGWREGHAELVCFVDDDCEADPGWLAALANAAATNPGSVIQGRTIPIDRELTAGGPLVRTKLIERAGPWYQTCNIAYPRSLLEALGGFDRTFSIAGEDTDLGWRARAAGREVIYVPDALVAHAVELIGMNGWLAIARRERVLAALFARHPALRREVATWGVFRNDHHALFVLAAAGAVLAPRAPAAAVLALPYLRLLLARCRADRAGPQWAGWYSLYDAVAVANSLRGAVEHRVALI
jgi:GT2 family glycosyltransferase